MKTFFFCIVFVCSLVVNAQITKGNWLVGGDISYFSISSDSENLGESETSYFFLTPNLGYFFIDKLAGGVDFELRFIDPFKSVSSESYGLNPFLRYYFRDQDKLINIFTQATFIYGFSKNGLNAESDTIGYGLEVGSVLFFNQSVGIEFTLSYDRFENTFGEMNNSATNNQVTLGLGFQIHLEK